MPDRAAALSEQLVQVHRELRQRLAALRREAAGGPVAAGEDLLSHCLGFCSAVRSHHNGEDGQLLPALRAASPELAPVIDNLIEDHVLVAGILEQIRALADRAHASQDAFIRELDGLTAILDSHFSYEERRIASALDALGPSAWTADVFAPGQDLPGLPGEAALVVKIPALHDAGSGTPIPYLPEARF